MTDICLGDVGRGDALGNAIQECTSDRDRFHTTFWLLNHLKYMDVPSASGWKRTAERLRKMGNLGIEAEAARMFSRSFNKASIRGWQDLILASIAVYASLEWNAAHSERIVERLIDNAHSDKNKVAIQKWEYTRDTLMRHDNVQVIFGKIFDHFDQSINDGSVSPLSGARFLDALPYGPGAETKEQKREREAKQALADQDDDDF